MPTYEYACAECGERLEAVQKFTDDPLTVCPVCAGRLRKLFSPVGIVFKGSGFYRTDSRGSTVNGAKDKQLNGASADSPAGREKPSGAEAKPSGSGSESSGSGSESSANGAKSGKKAGSGGSGASSSTGAKVA